jgi:manganese transport protein
MLLQHLALKLGVASGRDLAQACRDALPRWTTYPLWLMAEVAICACDLAEVIGAAVALRLLFGLPLWAGVLITLADVALVMLLEGRGFRWLEAFVALLIAFISGCFIYEMVVAQPDWAAVARGLLPTGQLFTNPDMLFVSIGILGATVMPHNLYLHPAIIQTRAYPRTRRGRASAIRFGTLDSTLSLLVAFFINAAILVLAGAAFHLAPGSGWVGRGAGAACVARAPARLSAPACRLPTTCPWTKGFEPRGRGGNPKPGRAAPPRHPRSDVDIQDAYRLLSPTLGAKAASVVFALALLASGQNSTITGTLAGQVRARAPPSLSLLHRPCFQSVRACCGATPCRWWWSAGPLAAFWECHGECGFAASTPAAPAATPRPAAPSGRS